MEKKSVEHQGQIHRELFKLSTLTILLLILLALFYSGCSYDCNEYTYTYYEPNYQSLDSLRSTVGLEAPRQIGEPGGLYYKDGIVFINERGAGVHIIDNTIPNSPQSVSFLNIPGNMGMAAKGNFLYTDSYSDLLIWDISNPNAVSFVKRLTNVYQNFSAAGAYMDFNRQMIVSYTERTEKHKECDFEDPFVIYEDEGDFSPQFGDAESGTGVAGSMARFVVVDDVLYTVDYSSMNVFDVTNASDPLHEGQVEIGWGIETIFPYENKLFIGSESGMFIYDNAIPLEPELLSTYSHITACDPVVVQDDFAYVTLRSGTECSGFTNQLDIVNVADPRNPFLEKTYQMSNPHGLGINGTCLFICEGDYGMRSFQVDINDPTMITQTAFNTEVAAFDVIPLPGVLLMVGKDGFYQYTYGCGQDLEYLSKIGFGL